jgi:hypothetical protein
VGKWKLQGLEPGLESREGLCCGYYCEMGLQSGPNNQAAALPNAGHTEALAAGNKPLGNQGGLPMLSRMAVSAEIRHRNLSTWQGPARPWDPLTWASLNDTSSATQGTVFTHRQGAGADPGCVCGPGQPTLCLCFPICKTQMLEHQPHGVEG